MATSFRFYNQDKSCNQNSGSSGKQVDTPKDGCIIIGILPNIWHTQSAEEVNILILTYASRNI